MFVLLLILSTKPFKIYAYDVQCNPFYAGYLSLSASDARAAANLIPTLFFDAYALARNSTGSLVLPPTSRQVSYLVIFHSGDAAIEIYQVSIAGVRRRLLPSDQVFILWPMAKSIALDIIQECVVANQGEQGGHVQFQVMASDHSMRGFVLSVRRRPFNLQQLQQNWLLYQTGPQIWPAVEP